MFPQIQYHRNNHILVFDDSKPHRAFNNSENAERVVLIIDMWRPQDIPRGTATGNHTPELDTFVSQFR
jgi:aspartyl/asparaginyl beta-hydroxylase (cupin superfamily)